MPGWRGVIGVITFSFFSGLSTVSINNHIVVYNLLKRQNRRLRCHCHLESVGWCCGLSLTLSPSGEPGPVGFRRHLHGITETMALTLGLG